MNRTLSLAIAAGLLCSVAAFGRPARDAAPAPSPRPAPLAAATAPHAGVMQTPASPVTATVKAMLERQAKNLVGAAEEMPADKYGYSPTKDQMTFGHLMAHVAGSNAFVCSKIAGSAAPAGTSAKDSEGKEKIVAALKASFDYCRTALGAFDDSKLGNEVEFFGGRKATLARAIIELPADWGDHYATAANYLRLNGLLPPSAKRGEM